jgi:hypothetical protein
MAPKKQHKSSSKPTSKQSPGVTTSQRTAVPRCTHVYTVCKKHYEILDQILTTPGDLIKSVHLTWEDIMKVLTSPAIRGTVHKTGGTHSTISMPNLSEPKVPERLKISVQWPHKNGKGVFEPAHLRILRRGLDEDLGWSMRNFKIGNGEELEEVEEIEEEGGYLEDEQ